jgi:hypothetical protein
MRGFSLSVYLPFATHIGVYSTSQLRLMGISPANMLMSAAVCPLKIDLTTVYSSGDE